MYIEDDFEFRGNEPTGVGSSRDESFEDIEDIDNSDGSFDDIPDEL